MGKIARPYKISTVAVLKGVKAAALEAKPINPVSESDIVMIDEVWHFVCIFWINPGSDSGAIGSSIPV